MVSSLTELYRADAIFENILDDWDVRHRELVECESHQLGSPIRRNGGYPIGALRNWQFRVSSPQEEMPVQVYLRPAH